MTLPAAVIRHDWTRKEVHALFELPFNDLIFRAQMAHRQHFPANEVQISTLLSIKTGACPEDCKYCPQSVRYDTGLERESLMDVATVREAARAARDGGVGHVNRRNRLNAARPERVGHFLDGRFVVATFLSGNARF